MTARGRSLLIGAVCLLCGLSVGYLIGHFVQAKETIEAVQFMQEFESAGAENDAQLRLRMIELAESGQNETLIRANCALLFMRLRHLEPTAFGDRAESVKQFKERAQNKVAELQNAGRCPFKPAAKP